MSCAIRQNQNRIVLLFFLEMPAFLSVAIDHARILVETSYKDPLCITNLLTSSADVENNGRGKTRKNLVPRIREQM